MQKYFVSSIIILFSSVALVFSGCSSSSPRVAVVSSFAEVTAKPQVNDEVPSIHPQHWTLDNGLEVLFLPDDELPLVSGTLFMRGGFLWEAENERGVVAAMGDQLRQGGAGNLSADALDRRLEVLAAGISSNFGQEFGRVTFSSLAADFPEIMGLVSDIVLKPSFDQERLDLWKGQAAESIRRRVDDPGTVAGTSLTQLLYAGTPYGRVSTTANVAKIDRKGVLRAYQKFVKPNGAILAISGRLTREEVEQAVQKAFGAWSRSTQSLPAAPAVPESKNKKSIVFIEQPLQQTTIYAGQLGVPRLSEDQFGIEAFNSVFGSGGFGSRLMKRVRTEMGLAYVVYGAISPGVVRGKNLIVLQTKAESTVSALTEALRELEKMKSEPITKEELAETVDAIEHTFVFNFQSPESIIAREAQLQLLGYPKDYDQTYLDKVRSLTPDDVQKVALKRWDLNDFAMVVVGNKDTYQALAQMMQNPPEFLKGFSLQRGKFDQKLILGE